MRAVGIVALFILGWTSFATWTVVLGTCILADSIFGRRRRFSAHALAWAWGRMHYTTSPLWRVHQDGTEHVGDGPYIIVSNHQSMVDIPSVLSLGLPCRICARDGLFRVPLIGPFFGLSRQLRTRTFIDDGRQCLEDGLSVLVFPEGTRTVDGRIGPFYSGAFRLARQTGIPVLPVVIHGSDKVLPKSAWAPTEPFVRVRVRALAPVDPAAYPSVHALVHHTRELLRAELGRMHSRESMPERPELPSESHLVKD